MAVAEIWALFAASQCHILLGWRNVTAQARPGSARAQLALAARLLALVAKMVVECE